MGLVLVLGSCAVEDDAESYLVALVHDRPGAGGHLADMEALDTRGLGQVALGARHELVRRVGLGGIRSEDHDVREHAGILETGAGWRQCHS